MRNFITLIENALAEAPRTKTKPPEQMTLDIEGPSSKGDLTTTSGNAHNSVAHGRDRAANLPGKKQSKAQTKAAIKPMSAAAQDDMRGIMQMVGDTQDEISDDEAARRAGHDSVGHTDGMNEPPTPQNLPAIINTAVAASGMHIEPKWHMVRNLPGYMQSGIRALGRQLFGPFTDTPIEDIQVLSTLSNDDTEVKAMMTWIKRNGVKDDEAQIKFDNSPASRYGADVQIWNAEGFTFMVVKDPHGYYVYGWPGGRGTQVGHDAQPMARLR